MKRSKFSEEQITFALRQHEAGTPVEDVCRQLGVSQATFYVWKKKYSHMRVSELRELRQLGQYGDSILISYGATGHGLCVKEISILSPNSSKLLPVLNADMLSPSGGGASHRSRGARGRFVHCDGSEIGRAHV